MLGQEASAWLAYTILFCLFSIALTIHSVSQWHSIPFALFAIFTAAGSLFVVLTPSFSEPNKPWRDEEPILNQLPVYSILLFAGMIDCQFVYIRFIATTLKNHQRWASLHPVIITEKGDAATGHITPTKNKESHLDRIYSLCISISESSSSFLFSYWMFCVYIAALILYAIIIIAFVTCKIVITDSKMEALISSSLITALTFLSLLNTMVVIYTGSRCHSKLISRIMGQNGRDTAILLLIPILFAIFMTSTTIIAWTGYTAQDPFRKPFGGDLTKWILAKAFSVYLPITILLLSCMFKKREYKSLIHPVQSTNKNLSLERPPTRLLNPNYVDDANNKRVFVKP